MVQLEAGHNAHGELTLFALVSCCLSPPSLLLRADHTLRLCCLASDPGWHLPPGSDAQSSEQTEVGGAVAEVVLCSFLEQLDGKLNAEVLMI